jgi:hypothetical protein
VRREDSWSVEVAGNGPKCARHDSSALVGSPGTPRRAALLLSSALLCGPGLLSSNDFRPAISAPTGPSPLSTTCRAAKSFRTPSAARNGSRRRGEESPVGREKRSLRNTSRRMSSLECPTGEGHSEYHATLDRCRLPASQTAKVELHALRCIRGIIGSLLKVVVFA